ncbi:hypothetical protein KKIDH5335_31940 [Vibrio fluvialis]|nr:hypothetical protein KKIDH5335_31940 [Vibrio fluvialis]
MVTDNPVNSAIVFNVALDINFFGLQKFVTLRKCRIEAIRTQVYVGKILTESKKTGS